MKAITLHQPWASLIAIGAKTIETRGWSTKYRGPLAIHAAQRRPEQGLKLGDYFIPTYVGARPAYANQYMGTNSRLTIPLPLGAVVATCYVADCVPIIARDEYETCDKFVRILDPAVDDMALTLHEGFGEYRDLTGQLPYGDFSPGRYAWLLDNIQALPEPVPAKGKQGFWEWTE